VTFNILVIEDEIDFREVLVDLLKLKGYEATGIDSIAAYSRIENRDSFHLIILDRTLSDGDGLDILKLHRQISNIPVIILSGLGDADERVRGLTADADYYLVKPVVMPELLTIIKRYSQKEITSLKKQQSKWTLLLQRWQLISPNRVVIELSNSETLFLNCFKNTEGVGVDRNIIIESLGYRREAYDVRRLESLVSRLRNKVKDAGAGPFPLNTVYGTGYAFNEPLVVFDDVV
jgi:two-component system, OmpR family, response regulator